ncbi:hypothetical protein PH505_aj00390 [Pseudoalteromonas distincta]|nr:hypothetical protein PH505_aj00390 [Pseudoalteromonas distincta]
MNNKKLQKKRELIQYAQAIFAHCMGKLNAVLIFILKN